MDYLDDDPLARSILAQAVQMHIKITIVTGQNEDGQTTDGIFWNPTAALRLTNGGIMSPAMCLIHELAHAIFNLSTTYIGGDYDNAEDRYIIENVEHVIAATLHEPTRNDHRGEWVWGQTDVTHHEPPPDLGDFRI